MLSLARLLVAEDRCERSNLVEVPARRILHLGVLLEDDPDRGLAADGLLERLDRLSPPDHHGCDDAGKEDDVSDREDNQRIVRELPTRRLAPLAYRVSCIASGGRPGRTLGRACGRSLRIALRILVHEFPLEGVLCAPKRRAPLHFPRFISTFGARERDSR